MKYITVMQTFDGKLHNNAKEAKHHLDVMYSNMIRKLSIRLVAYTDGKYQRTQEFIDHNLQLFADLKQIRDDMEIVHEEDQE